MDAFITYGTFLIHMLCVRQENVLFSVYLYLFVLTYRWPSHPFYMQLQKTFVLALIGMMMLVRLCALRRPGPEASTSQSLNHTSKITCFTPTSIFITSVHVLIPLLWYVSRQCECQGERYYISK